MSEALKALSGLEPTYQPSAETAEAIGDKNLIAVIGALFEYVKADVTTNTIEGFWSQLKRSVDGTHHAVSPKYLQQYVNEFVFRYNHRAIAVCPVLLERAAKRV